MSNKIKYSIQNLSEAYSKLVEYLSEPIQNDRDRSGIIKAFEFTFELAWKTMQKCAQDEGLHTGGPKSALKAAFQMDLIKAEHENSWLLMLDDRNLMSHTYKEKLALEIVERIKKQHQARLQGLLETLQKKY